MEVDSMIGNSVPGGTSVCAGKVTDEKTSKNTHKLFMAVLSWSEFDIVFDATRDCFAVLLAACR
jgi:hypothetical protein